MVAIGVPISATIVAPSLVLLKRNTPKRTPPTSLISDLTTVLAVVSLGTPPTSSAMLPELSMRITTLGCTGALKKMSLSSARAGGEADNSPNRGNTAKNFLLMTTSLGHGPDFDLDLDLSFRVPRTHPRAIDPIQIEA